ASLLRSPRWLPIRMLFTPRVAHGLRWQMLSRAQSAKRHVCSVRLKRNFRRAVNEQNLRAFQSWPHRSETQARIGAVSSPPAPKGASRSPPDNNSILKNVKGTHARQSIFSRVPFAN